MIISFKSGIVYIEGNPFFRMFFVNFCCYVLDLLAIVILRYISNHFIFTCKRVREVILRYISNCFHMREGTRDHLAFHLKLFSHARGYVRLSYVTSQTIFTCERVREIVLRYISTHFHMREGTRDYLAFHLKPFSHARGHARSSCVSSQTVFTCKRVREIVLRYISNHFHMREGTRDHLALHLNPFSHARGYARSSCVTSQTVFTCERVRETVLRYISKHFHMQEGTRDHLAFHL